MQFKYGVHDWIIETDIGRIEIKTVQKEEFSFDENGGTLSILFAEGNNALRKDFIIEAIVGYCPCMSNCGEKSTSIYTFKEPEFVEYLEHFECGEISTCKLIIKFEEVKERFLK